MKALKLLTKRKFLPLFVLFQAGTLNDNVLKNALIALVTYGGMVLFSPDLPEKGLVAIAALLFTLPFLLLCTIAGQIADKVDRGTILKYIKRAELCIMVIAALGFFLENTYILAIALSLMGAQSAFFSPTKNAVLPQWLEDKDLIAGNGMLSGFQFFFILVGMIVGIKVVLMPFEASAILTGQRAIALILLGMAVLGWIAGEQVPEAPAPKPDLVVDYNPITSIIGVMKTAFNHMNVFRPMLGIAWFYGFSNILILVLPDLVKNTMGYTADVLIIVLIASTLSILVGSLLCIVLAKGREALWLVFIGIAGVSLFTLDLYLNDLQAHHEGLLGMEAFRADSRSLRFMIDIIGSSVCAGLFIVPLQAMSQRRAPREVRARLMSAGAVMLNLSVNLVTFCLIALGFTQMSPKTPFVVVVVVSAIVAIYTLRRLISVKKDKQSAQ